MSVELQRIRRDSITELNEATNIDELEQVRLKYVGKKGIFRKLLQQLATMPADQRAEFGSVVNSVKQDFADNLQERKKIFSQQKLANQLAQQAIDVSLPGTRQASGRLHPLSITRRRIETIFRSLGYSVFEGPEIEDDYHNFEALNIPELHPARAMHDTFYLKNPFANGMNLLRTHTSSVQVRTMELVKPPIRAITIGRAYRCDSDVTHTPMFHQMECLLIDKDVSFANLKATLSEFVRAFFEKDVPIRLRPSFFPFTEPSAEVDIGCVHCDGSGCRICSNTGWLEILGSGLIHPAVLEHVDIDSSVYSGFAFGVGLERLAMLKYKVDDLRLFFDNNFDFLQQFH